MKNIMLIIMLIALVVGAYVRVTLGGASTYHTGGMFAGMINNALMVYTTTTSVTFKTGNGECNGSFWEITSDTAHTVVNYSSGKYTYIYVDDSASSYPTPTIIDDDADSVEPAWSDAKQGWYNGNDRCIGAVYADGAATIDYFDAKLISNKEAQNVLLTRLDLATAMNPTGAWQTPDEGESSTLLPVNVHSGLFQIYGRDADSGCVYAITTKELADETPGASSGLHQYISANDSTISTVARVALATSRNVRLQQSDDDDDGLMYCWIQGFTYSR